MEYSYTMLCRRRNWKGVFSPIQPVACPNYFTTNPWYRVSQKTWEFSDEFDIVFSNNSLI